MGNGSPFQGYVRQLAAFCAVLLVCAAPLAAGVCDPGTVELRGDWGKARFSVELADEPEEQARGLMFRESLPMGSGMYFVNAQPRSTSFWMRNTLIPLDMLFIDARGVVQRIHHMAVPLDETSIPGGDGILTVLEINGGLAKRLGITEGSEVRHPAHATHAPVWPC